MIKKKPYLLLFAVIFLLDRITKYSMFYYTKEYTVNSFLSFNLTFNRGIAWGIFNTGDTTTFFSISLLIILTYAVLTGVTLYRWCAQSSIMAEVFILAGGLSNILDRFFYHGVIDFIVCQIGSWTWPAFNIADASIVVGVLLMGITCLAE